MEQVHAVPQRAEMVLAKVTERSEVMLAQTETCHASQLNSWRITP